MTAAVVVESRDELGECPVWDPARSELLWTDIHGRRLHRLTSDRAAVDESGCIWNARWGAWGIARFTPDGVLDTIVDVPVPQPSAVTFGGDDLGTLYITTAREHLSPGDPRYELSGALFARHAGSDRHR